FFLIWSLVSYHLFPYLLVLLVSSFFLLIPRLPGFPFFPYTTLFRSLRAIVRLNRLGSLAGLFAAWFNVPLVLLMGAVGAFFGGVDRKSTRLNSSHVSISYAVFCLLKKKPRYNHFD